MKHIQLHGALADKFGEHWTLDVASPAEALRGIAANRPGFLQHIIESDKSGIQYRVVLGERDVAADDLAAPYGKEILHIVPVMAGAKSAGAGIVLGALLIAAAVMSGGAGVGLMTAYTAGGVTAAAGSLAFSIGVSLVLGGVSQMLVGNPASTAEAQQAASVDGLPSYQFNGPTNRMQAGAPVPIGYGRMMVGAMPISAGISTENIT